MVLFLKPIQANDLHLDEDYVNTNSQRGTAVVIRYACRVSA